MRLFLTGGTGFIGSHFLKESLERELEVIALKRSVDSQTKIPLHRDPEWLIKPMSEVDTSDFEGVDVLVHLAAHSANVPYDSLENCVLANVIEPLRLFRKAQEFGVSKFVVAGSCFEYGNSGERYEFIPTTAPLEATQTYPASKAMSSIAFYQFALENKVQLSYHRIFQVYGEGESDKRLWPSLKRAALNGEDFEMTAGEQVRDFVEVVDVAKLLLEAVSDISKSNDLTPLILNLGSGNPQTILEFSEYWWKRWGASGKLHVGRLPYRKNEVMRFVPKI